MIRVLHFSDVHLEDGFEGVSPAAFMNKRLVGLLNLRLNRGSHFKHAEQKVKKPSRYLWSEQSRRLRVGHG